MSLDKNNRKYGSYNRRNLKNKNQYTEEGYESDPNYSRKYQSREYKKYSKRQKLYRRKQRRQRGRAVKGAQNQLKRFKQGSMLAVAITSFLLILFTPDEVGYSQNQQDSVVMEDSRDLPDSVSIIENVAVDDIRGKANESSANEEVLDEDIGEAAKDEAITTLRNLWDGFYANLPKILVAVVILIIAWLLVRLLRILFRKISRGRQSSGAALTLVFISIWLLAIGLAVSVVAGDIRALVGSLGLIGLALSWSLQTPIESFSGWLMNSFRGYYKVGDRISVGDVFGDVYKIDFLTTTVWEIGAPFRPGFVQAEQPTGRLVTFPNNEILTGTVVNLTGDFPYVWDELAIAVANESDFRMAMEVMEKKAIELMGEYMEGPANRYEDILRKAGLTDHVPDKPQVFLSIGESWTDVVIRYLVGARERRKWKSHLSLHLIEELNKDNYSGKIKAVYPRQQVQIIKPDGLPEEPMRFGKKE